MLTKDTEKIASWFFESFPMPDAEVVKMFLAMTASGSEDLKRLYQIAKDRIASRREEKLANDEHIMKMMCRYRVSNRDFFVLLHDPSLRNKSYIVSDYNSEDDVWSNQAFFATEQEALEEYERRVQKEVDTD